MPAQIHPTALVEAGAELSDGVVIEAFAYVGARVVLGKGTVVRHHATVQGKTILGADNEVGSYALIGGLTQDLKYDGGDVGVIIGDGNVFREYVTVHTATPDGEYTRMGNHNLMLAYSHVAHDCLVGNHMIMSASSALGGHCILGDHVNIGWNAGVHQFCQIGDYAMAAACSKVVQDIPPLMIADGNPAAVRTFNKVGMERHGFSPDEVKQAKDVYKILYRQGLNRSQALQALRGYGQAESRVVSLIESFAEQSARGFA